MKEKKKSVVKTGFYHWKRQHKFSTLLNWATCSAKDYHEITTGTSS